MKNPIKIFLIIIIFISIYVILNNNSNMMNKEEVINNATSATNSTNTTQEIINSTTTKLNKDTSIKGAIYKEYDTIELANSSADKNILFFHASWCPSCKSLNKSIENDINDVAENINIYKVNYDENNDLKKKYGVTYQHTLVQVDKEGNMIKKWSGSSNLKSLISEIK